MPDHVYIVVHLDQPSEQVLVQAAHAAADAGSHFLSPDRSPPSLAILSVPDEATLLAWRDAVHRWGIRTRRFFEPDFAPSSTRALGHHTTFATEAIEAGLCHVFSGLPPVRFRKGVIR